MRIIFAAAVVGVALQGCTTDEPSSGHIVCVSEHATVGSQFPAHAGAASGRAERRLFIVTKIHGRTQHCARGDWPIMARAIPSSRAKEFFGPAGVPVPPSTRSQQVAVVDEDDMLLTGDLHLAIDTVHSDALSAR